MGTLILRPRFDNPVAFAEPGTRAPNFKLADPDGRTLSLYDLRGKAVVLFFTSLHSPDCVGYTPRIESLARRYKNDARVQFVAVNLDADVDPLQVRVESKILGRSFPTLIDSKSEVATLYSVKSAPQVAVIDPEGTLRYRGPFDDSASEGSITQRYCAEALSNLLANRELAFMTK
jgi:peroxiredoxin